MKLEDMPYVKKIRGKTYVRITYKDSTGKERAKHKLVTSRDEYHRAVDDLKRQLRDLGPSAWDGERMTFADLLNEYEKTNPRWPEYFYRPMREYFTTRRIRSITYGDLRQFKASREAVPRKGSDGPGQTPIPRKPATIHREVERLRGVLLYALRHGWIQRNPFQAGPPLIAKAAEEQRDRLPTPAEEAALLAQCVGPRAHLRIAIIATLDTGLRRSALFSLRWRDVDFEAGLIAVPPAPTAIKKRPKLIGLTTRLKIELQSIQAEKKPSPDDFIVTGSKQYRHAFPTACRYAGVEGLRFNDLRHGFATRLMLAGVDLRLAMKIAGHTQAGTHERYVNTDRNIALQVAKQLDEWQTATTSDAVQ